MDRFAVFVDGGYYNVAASFALSGTTGRRQVRFDLPHLARAVLAQERSISDAVLITGDEDMREAVVYAQERGVRVHLVIAAGSPASWTLRQEADTVTTLMPDHFIPFTLPTHGPRAA